jgi:MacB-like protein
VFAFHSIYEPINVVADETAEIASGQFVSGNYFVALGASAAMGRVILPDDDKADARPVVVISDGCWNRRFGRSPNVVGKTISINGAAFAIVGVTAPEFFGAKLGTTPDLSVTFAMQSQITPDRPWGTAWQWWVEMMGRVKPGVTRAQVLADVRPLFEDSVREVWDSRPARYRTPSFATRNADFAFDRRNDARRPDPQFHRDVPHACNFYQYLWDICEYCWPASGFMVSFLIPSHGKPTRLAFGWRSELRGQTSSAS